jgi:tetratricopeptide (TPR) repeat protein
VPPRLPSLLAVVALALTLTTGAVAALGSFERALNLEKQGRFDEAAAVLASAKHLAPEKAKHANALKTALRTLIAADVYGRNGQREQEELTLKALVKKLDPVRDVFIRSQVARRLASVVDKEHGKADREARATLRRARELEQENQFDDAADTFGRVASAADSGISNALIQEGMIGKLRAQREDADADHDKPLDEQTMDWVGAKGEALAGWADTLLPLIVALGLITLLFHVPGWRAPTQDRTEIKLTDWSAERSERGQKSLALSRQLKAEIDAASRPTVSGTEVDETRDLDGSGVPGLIPGGDEISGLDAVIPEDSSIKIGPVAFSLAQLLSVIRTPFRRRPARELTGALTHEGDRTIISAELVPAGEKTPMRQWLVRTSGTDSRASALADLALEVAVDLGQPYVSSNWRSVREYRAAVETLASQENGTTEERLTNARRLLQRALDHDPRNLLARFYLATVERASGRNIQSVKQLDFLQTLLPNDPTRTDSAALFLQRHPEFESLIEYNQAVALTKIEDWKCHNRAMQILSKLWTTFSTESNGDTGGERRRLLALVRSAEASALVFELEEWRTRPDDTRLATKKRETLERIRAARDGLRQTSANAPPRESLAYVQAVAAAENAYGRALHVTGGTAEEAVEALDTAVTLAPELTDAWLNLAAVLIDRKHGFDWASRAEYALGQALELAPRSPKAHYLRGELYEKRARYAEAKAEFSQIPGDYLAAMKLAQLAEREGDFKTAAKEMKRSLDLRPTLNFRVLLYVEYLLHIAQKEPEVLDEAERWAKKLAARGEPQGMRRRAKKLLGDIQDMRPP